MFLNGHHYNLTGLLCPVRKKSKRMLRIFLEDKMEDLVWDITIGTVQKMQFDQDWRHSP